MRKGSKLYSIFKMRCPHCHEGKFFKSHPYDLKNAGEIYDTCEACGRKLSIEPGFYYGAMYVAYALGVATFVSCVVAIWVLFPEAATWTYIATIGIAIVVLGPWIYALSKIIWANFFISYKKESNEN